MAEHTLVVGVTGSGKSTLVKGLLVPGWIRRGYKVLVFDPVRQPWPGVYWQTDNAERFLEAAERSRKCVLVVDEGRHLRATAALERRASYLGAQSRNDGHVCILIGQRAMQLPPDIRGNCERAFVFRQHRKDAAIIAEEMGRPELVEEAVRLPKGQCLWVSSFAETRCLSVFSPNRVPQA